MEVADSIVVMAQGQVQQVGTPDDLYDRPASDFVMSFLGPVTKLGGQLVRPHDVDVLTEPEPDTIPGVVTRITRLGFEVRVDLKVAGEDTWVQLTRDQLRRRGLGPGSEVHLRASASRPERVGSPA